MVYFVFLFPLKILSKKLEGSKELRQTWSNQLWRNCIMICDVLYLLIQLPLPPGHKINLLIILKDYILDEWNPFLCLEGLDVPVCFGPSSYVRIINRIHLHSGETITREIFQNTFVYTSINSVWLKLQPFPMKAFMIKNVILNVTPLLNWFRLTRQGSRA